MNFLQFLKEDNGNYSSARLFALLISLSFIADYIIHIYRNIEFAPAYSVIGVVLGAIGLKVVQKFSEVKTNDSKNVNIET